MVSPEKSRVFDSQDSDLSFLGALNRQKALRMTNEGTTNTKESMKDILALMEKNGIKVSGFEAEAEDLWKTLDELSKSSPSEYQRFLEQQAANHNISDPAEKEEKFFRPIAGFSVTTRTTGGDGVKIRDSSNQETMGKALYINFCGHEAIEVPLDSFGRPVKDAFLTSADGLQIPLIVGPLRDLSANEIAVDVVFHPCVIDYSLKVPTKQFMNQIIDLAFEWVTQETSVTFSKTSWKSSSASYMGGRGSDKKTPVLFPVSFAIKQKDGNGKASVSASALDSPSSLLSSIREDISRETKLEGLNVNQTASKKSAVNLSESSSSASSASSSSSGSAGVASTSSKDQPKKPAVKKGFLLDRKDPGLYPDEGSSEGTGGAAGGSLSRIMDKCKVVNMNADNSIRSSSKPPTALLPLPPPAAPALGASKTVSSGTMKNKKPNKELDALFAKLDSDLNPLCTDKPSFDEGSLADLAKVLCSTDMMAQCEEPGMASLFKDIQSHFEGSRAAPPRVPLPQPSNAASSAGSTMIGSKTTADINSSSTSTTAIAVNSSSSSSSAHLTADGNATVSCSSNSVSSSATALSSAIAATVGAAVLKVTNKLGGSAVVSTKEEVIAEEHNGTTATVTATATATYLIITVSEADEAVLDLSSADLQVSANELVLKLGSDKTRYLKVKGFNNVDQSSTKASVSKKKKTLSIKMKYTA